MAVVVQQVLPEDPFGGAAHALRGRYPLARGDWMSRSGRTHSGAWRRAAAPAALNAFQ